MATDNFTRNADYYKSSFEQLQYLLENKFDPAIVTLKSELNNRLESSVSAIVDLSNEDFDEFDDSSIFKGLRNWHQGLDYHSAREEYTAIAEMQIIYAYKHIEIGIKILIRGSYNENGKGFYKWDNIISFLKAKGIDIKSIDGFCETNELRQVNNNIKHSDEIQEDVKRIVEFNNRNKFDFLPLTQFYNRVKPFTKVFLTDLAHKISEERFSFSLEKMEAMAKELYERMDKTTMEAFVAHLKDYYDKHNDKQ